MWIQGKNLKVLSSIVFLFILITGLIAVRRTLSGSNDFDTFFEAGRSVIEGRGIYYTGEYRQDSRNVAPFLYPPFAAFFFLPFGLLPLPVAAFIWNALNVIFFMACIFLSSSLLGVRPSELKGSFSQLPLWLRLLLGIMLLALLLDNLSMAQMNIFVLTLTLASLVLWKQAKPFFSGTLLSLAILAKVTPAFFILYLLIKRSWKTIAFFFVGLLLFSAIIPSLIWGIDTNRIYHRQWAGRMIKPMVIGLLEVVKPTAPHPKKKPAEEAKFLYLGEIMVDKNQSLAGTLSRLFLKDRDDYAYHGQYPLYPVRDYIGLPVIGGGLSIDSLNSFVGGIRFLFLMCVVGLFMRNRPEQDRPLEISLAFLSITLLSPLSRSHHFIFWLFPLLTMLWYFSKPGHEKIARYLKACLIVAFFFYSAQALPYGKAAGMGTWANLVLWFGMVSCLSKASLK